MKRLELLNQISALKTEKRTDAITPQRVGSILQEMATITPEDSMPGSEEMSTQLTQLLDQMKELTHNYELSLQDYQRALNQIEQDIAGLENVNDKLAKAVALPVALPFDGITSVSGVVDGTAETTQSLKIHYHLLWRRFVAGPLDGKYYTLFAGCEDYNANGKARLDAIYKLSTNGDVYRITENYTPSIFVSLKTEDDGSSSEADAEMILPFHGIAATSAAATTVGAIYYNSSAKAFYTKKSSASFELLQDERYNVNIGVIGATVHANPARFFSLEMMTGACYLCFAKADGSLLRIETTAV